MSNKCPNLKDFEKRRIFQLAVKYKKVIEGKETDSNSINERNCAWEKIANAFNATTVHKRTVKQLKTFYKNAKTSLKKSLSEEKKERQKTGGGTFVSKVDTNHPLLEIVTEEITPLSNPYDCCSDYFLDTSQESEIEQNLQVLLGENENEVPLEKETSNDQEAEKPNETDLDLIEKAEPCYKNKKWARKRKTNEELRQYVQVYSELKKKKLESDILKNKKKTEMFEKKTELLNLQIKQLIEKN